MTVADLRTELRTAPLPRPWGADVPANHVIVTHVTLKDGRTGTGFAWTPQIGAHAVRALLDHDLREALIGLPPHPEVVWDRLWRHTREAGPGGITTIALAGIDLALWDLRCGEAALPDVLGRRRDEVPVYGSGVNLHYSLEELVEQARRWTAAGLRGVKIKVGRPDLAEDVARAAAVREVIGPDRLLMIDANQRWDLFRARRAVVPGARSPPVERAATRSAPSCGRRVRRPPTCGGPSPRRAAPEGTLPGQRVSQTEAPAPSGSDTSTPSARTSPAETTSSSWPTSIPRCTIACSSSGSRSLTRRTRPA